MELTSRIVGVGRSVDDIQSSAEWAVPPPGDARSSADDLPVAPRVGPLA